MKITIIDLNQPQYQSEDHRYGEWITKKDEINYDNNKPLFNEGDIWWAAVGDNVDVEINGKNELFSRPVLVLRRLNARSFMAIPLTSQYHVGTWYVYFRFRGRNEYAVLAQARVMSAARLYSKIGRISQGDLCKIRKGFLDLYC